MNSEDILLIQQVAEGNHLEKYELQRAREILTNLLNNANLRYFEDELKN